MEINMQTLYYWGPIPLLHVELSTATTRSISALFFTCLVHCSHSMLHATVFFHVPAHPKYLGFSLQPLLERRRLTIPPSSNGSLSIRSIFGNISYSFCVSSHVAPSTGRCFHCTKLSSTRWVPCLTQW